MSPNVSNAEYSLKVGGCQRDPIKVEQTEINLLLVVVGRGRDVK